MPRRQENSDDRSVPLVRPARASSRSALVESPVPLGSENDREDRRGAEPSESDQAPGSM
jgi:hypothetical protein